MFDSDPRFLIDFTEAFDMMLNVLKRIFKDALKTDQMIKGDAILVKSRPEQDEIILLLVKDLVEILTNFQLITTYFGSVVLEQVTTTNFLVNLTNAYCLLRKIRRLWLKGCSNQEVGKQILEYIENGIKLTTQVSADVIQRGIMLRIGVHSKNFAIVQNKFS